MSSVQQLAKDYVYVVMLRIQILLMILGHILLYFYEALKFTFIPYLQYIYSMFLF